MDQNTTQTRPGAYAAARAIVSPEEDWADEVGSPGTDERALAASVARHFSLTLGQDLDHADAHQLYSAVALAVRERLMGRWRATRDALESTAARRTCYLSLEFLMGRSLSNAVHALELEGPLRDALESLGTRMEDVESLEHDAGLGNGGLGRLAACFLDSCAALALPVTGYGLRYRYGMFRQVIDADGHQLEQPDNWLRNGHVWELERPELAVRVPFGGHVEIRRDEDGRERHAWVATDDVLAVPHDVPIPGHGNGVVNTLRLWAAEATDEFDLHEFNAGGYAEAVRAKTSAENITMVLYPNDASENGKVLRLRQQYFLVAASLADAMRTWMGASGTLDGFADAHCFQLNDTHPSLAVAELMRILLDEHDLDWDPAWAIVTRTMAYTNHTLLPEALECWSLDMMRGLLPRPAEIIGEINRRFLVEVERKWPGDVDRRAAMSIVSFDAQPVVRMAHLAIVGSFSVNGVAELHSKLLREGLFRHFDALWPTRFNNKTNGVTQRRWLAQCNPGLRQLLDDVVGGDWVADLERIEAIAPLADDATFQARWREVRTPNKTRLLELVKARTGTVGTTDMLFDVQVKRMHEYKRQLLCALHAVHCYLDISEGSIAEGAGGSAEPVPRLILIAGKAAPGYQMAKSVIKLITSVARVIEDDPRTEGRLRLVFLPDYNVSAMETICPAADLSEQISTAGKEASGTGNMKFMMNGAVTIGTLDGANVEILDAVGEENFFRFGLDVEGAVERRRSYRPGEVIASDARVRRLMAAFDAGTFDGGAPDVIRHVLDAARSPEDPWLTIADLPDYLDAQARVADAWRDTARWTRMSILNTAHSARFSTDRTMRDYNRDIWKLDPVTPAAPGGDS